MPTSINRNSKPDTVFLSLPAGAGAAALATDAGQYRNNLTNATTYVHESPSARAAIISPREIAIVLSTDIKISGVLVEHGNGTSYTYRVELDAGTIICSQNGSEVLRLDMPDVDEDIERTFVIHWSTRSEGTGIVLARSELWICNVTMGTHAQAQAYHALSTTNTAWNLYIGANSAGGDAVDLSIFQSVRISRRFHSTTEGFEDWITETTPPTMTQVRRAAVLVPERSTLDITRDGSFAGPAHLWSGHAFLNNDRRLVGPLVNTWIPEPARITNAYTPTPWWRTAPGDATVRLFRPLSWNRPVCGKVTRARVRLFVRQTIEVGAVTAEVQYRCYSLDNLPITNGPPLPPLTYFRTAAATCDTNHGTGLGEWLDLGVLPLALDADGFTWFAIGVAFDEDSPLVGDTDARIVNVTIEPYYETSGEGGLDILAP